MESTKIAVPTAVSLGVLIYYIWKVLNDQRQHRNQKTHSDIVEVMEISLNHGVDVARVCAAYEEGATRRRRRITPLPIIPRLLRGIYKGKIYLRGIRARTVYYPGHNDMR